jgi:hypothetical protein
MINPDARCHLEFTRREFLAGSTAGLATAALGSWFNPSANAAEHVHPFDLRPQPWQRRDQPIISARTTKEAWCRVVTYTPRVIFHAGRFRMWYLGTSTGARSGDMKMGYAESADGVNWTPHPANPILTAKDVPWGDMVQTPFVLFDPDEAAFKMWFVSGKVTGHDSEGRFLKFEPKLGYATSLDGKAWKVHPEPIYPSGRSPCVIKEAPGRYRMWMGSSPKLAGESGLFENIYAFHSPDGLRWTREAEPILRPSGKVTTVIYPCVLREEDTWYLWHGGHVTGGRFEIFCATSKDGRAWDAHHDEAAFPTRPGTTAFDSRYCSTPSVVSLADRYLLYYCARDWQTDYIDGAGVARRDNASPYSHIGVAEIPKARR